MGILDATTFLPIISLLATLILISCIEIARSRKQVDFSETWLNKNKYLLNTELSLIKNNHITAINKLDKAAKFGQLSQGLFHDLINPLTSILLEAENLKNKKIKQAMDKISSYITDIRSFLSNEESACELNISEELECVLHLFSYKIRNENIKITTKFTCNYKLFGSKVKIKQIFINLISNAIDSFDQISDKRQREIKILTDQDLDNIIFIISDNGCGIESINLEKIFSPFFTTKDSKNGTGIGLSTIKSIIKYEMNGSIEVRSQKNIGTTFTIQFPKSY